MITPILYLAIGGAVARLLVRFRRISAATAAVLVLLPLALTGRALVQGAVYGPLDLAYTSEPLASIATAAGAGVVSNPAVSDVYTEFFPWNVAVRSAVQHGEWPHWNPFVLSGTPLEAAVQIALYHPITVVQHLVPIENGITLAAALAYLLAACTAFLLAYELTRSESAALFAAAGWMFSTSVIFFAGTALTLSLAVMPLVLLGARRTATHPGFGTAWLLGTALTLLVVSGHPETTLHAVAFGVAYFIFTLSGERAVRWRAVITTGLAAGVGTLLLCAIYLLPFFHAMLQSEEYAYRAAGYATAQLSAGPAQVAHRLLANFLPFLHGASGVEDYVHAPVLRHGWIGIVYGGWLLMAAAIGGLLLQRGRDRWFFLGSFVFGVGMAIGLPGLTEAVQLLPGFSIAVNDRMVTFASLGVAMLGAIGIEALRARPRAFATILGATAAVVVLAALFVKTPLPADYVRTGAARAALPLLIGAAVVLTLRFHRAAGILLVLLVAQRVGEAAWMQPTVPRSAFYPPFPGLTLMQTEEPSRIAGVSTTLPPNLSTHYALEDVRGFEALTLKRYHDTFPIWCVKQPVWSNRVDDLSRPFLSALNVRFAIVPANYAVPGTWLERHREKNYAILENTRVLPRAWIPASVHVASPAEVLYSMRSCSDFGAESWIEGKPYEHATNGKGTVHTARRGSGLRLTARLDSPAWIVVSNSAWRGWRATSAGRDVPLQIANHTMLGLRLPAGTHEVDLTYSAPGFREGAAVSAAALALLAVATAFRLRSRVPS